MLSNYLSIIAISLVMIGCGGTGENDSQYPIQTANTVETSTNSPSNSQTNLSLLQNPDSRVFFGPRNVTIIGRYEGGFIQDLDPGDRFGRDHDQAGDIDGDGNIDLIVGARSDDDGAIDAGAVYILFMNEFGSVKHSQKISALEGELNEQLGEGDFFGYGVAGIGDYNDDDIPDVAVSLFGRSNQAIYVLHLNSDGTVLSKVKNNNIVAQGLSAMDINQDGKVDLIAAHPNEDNGGAISILYLDEDSRVIPSQTFKISTTEGGLGDVLNVNDSFGGRESALLGDLDGDGTLEIAVGAFMTNNGDGAIWILSIDPISKTITEKQRIAPGTPDFNELIPNILNSNGSSGGQFGHALVAAGDLNGDGIGDLITGANQYGSGVGYILYLNADKTVQSFTRITPTEGGFDLNLIGTEDRFSRSISIVDRQRLEGEITINFGGGVSPGGSGSIYSLAFQACGLDAQSNNTFWQGGSTYFSNWTHSTQTVSTPLNFEQCVTKSFEYDAPYITFKASDGRCIIKSGTATLSNSEEGSRAYISNCPK